jgi:phosphotransferase system enzyme I (PtsI)
MIATAEEAQGFADAARAHGLDRVGVMVEVPSAALTARELLSVVDFVSIGTNDLAQYAFAADRLAGELAALLDPWQPALLALIQMVGAAGAELGRPVGVCGEAASDPLLALVLVGLGVTSLSMAPACLPDVRSLLAEHTLADCRGFAAAALEARTATAARARVAELAGEPGLVLPAS